MSLEDRYGIYSRPAHLASETWVDFELRTSLQLLASMEAELKKLRLRVIKERVHKSRVSLRRWFSVWSFLAEEGWEEKKFRKKVLRPLREFLKELGALRDCDVNIEIAEKLKCDDETLEDLEKARKRLKRRIDRALSQINPEELSRAIEKFLTRRAEELREFIKSKPDLDHSAFAHFDRYLGAHEEQVKKVAERASTPESLHKLRLSIKKWRYLLTECMGLTNLNLVRAQTVLGEIHDFDRLQPELELHPVGDAAALARLHDERLQLVNEFELLKKDLPYGLRPGLISYPPPGNSDLK
ncbi:MAG: CHAD domain-containing protein [Candidatus Obscuribacterales bacterium]|nr:CHAD domain-containing protein [Candidatus Obscuribacterales bacterium]